MLEGMTQCTVATAAGLTCGFTSDSHAIRTWPALTNGIFEAKINCKTQYQYLLGAIAIMMLSVTAIISILKGWWVLGRTVSLSPLEIAKAFNAPLLHSDQLSDVSIDNLFEGNRGSTGQIRRSELQA